MQASKSFKLALLKQMLLGFQLSGVSSQTISLQDRKSAIKLSADLALALARGGKRKWSKGLIDNISKEEQNKTVLKCILGNEYERLVAKPCCSNANMWKIPRCKKILRRSFAAVCSKKRKNLMRNPHSIKSTIIAKTLVERRTQVLKKLVPGGESLSGYSLLDETLDYAVALKAQADLMHCLLKAIENSKNKAHKGVALQEEKALTLGQ